MVGGLGAAFDDAGAGVDPLHGRGGAEVDPLGFEAAGAGIHDDALGNGKGQPDGNIRERCRGRCPYLCKPRLAASSAVEEEEGLDVSGGAGLFRRARASSLHCFSAAKPVSLCAPEGMETA